MAPFGAWKSPLSSEDVARGAVRFVEMHAAEDALYWLESRPQEEGRVALVCYDGKRARSLLETVSMRTRVHEYGGGAISVEKGGCIYSDAADGQLYTLDGTQLTAAEGWRFADGCGTIWVGERHGGAHVENCLVSIEGGGPVILASGHDFYSSPRLSPDGKRLAFVTWDFPDMQWDRSALWLGDMKEDGKLHNVRAIADTIDVSICGVSWSKEGHLHYVSDETGFWNLYRHTEERGGVNLCRMEAEFATPPWVFGTSSYAFLPDGTMICAYTVNGIDYLARISHQEVRKGERDVSSDFANPEAANMRLHIGNERVMKDDGTDCLDFPRPREKCGLGSLDPDQTHSFKALDLPYTSIQSVVVFQDRVYFFGASPTLLQSIICYDPKSGRHDVVKESVKTPLPVEEISAGEPITFKTQDDQRGHAFYYSPHNSRYQAPAGQLPPLLVKVHGGPTARSYHQLSLAVQYWTSRGFAYLDVNYGGSTGFGRAYRRRIEGKWGIVDVEDTVSAVNSLVARGLVDPKRLLIHGSSAGGYTVFHALIAHKLFAAGTSLYGVADLEKLCEETHKFEKHYIDKLVASYPDGIETLRQRSPINLVDQIEAPVLLLQGDADTVVPPAHSLAIFKALKKRRIPTTIVLFEGEGHGLRKAESIKRSLDAQLCFYDDTI